MSLNKDVLESVELAVQEYGKTLIDRDIKRWGNLHAENAVKLLPGQPPIAGRSNIMQQIGPQIQAMGVTQFEIATGGIEIFDNRAVAWGTYTGEMRSQNSNQTARIEGKFLSVYHRSADGEWLITHDCGN